MASDDKDHTYSPKFRAPRRMWDAYGRVTSRLGTDRSADLVDHIRDVITQHGDKQDLANLAAAEEEMAERRARKGGRPKRSPMEETLVEGATAMVQAAAPGLAKMREGFRRPVGSEENTR